MLTIKVINEYHFPKSLIKNDGHHYEEEWTKTEMFCPNCGKQEVWSGDGADYYVGTQYLCTNCIHSSYLDGTSKVIEENTLSIIEQIKTGIAITPSTRKVR